MVWQLWVGGVAQERLKVVTCCRSWEPAEGEADDRVKPETG